MLKSRTFAVASLFIFITGFGLFGGVYVLPLFLARVAGYDARQIGEAVFVAGLSQVLIAPLIARLSQKIDPREHARRRLHSLRAGPLGEHLGHVAMAGRRVLLAADRCVDSRC